VTERRSSLPQRTPALRSWRHPQRAGAALAESLFPAVQVRRRRRRLQRPRLATLCGYTLLALVASSLPLASLEGISSNAASKRVDHSHGFGVMDRALAVEQGGPAVRAWLLRVVGIE
jgi:hypothetical protein